MFANFSQNKMLHNLKQSVSCTFFASSTMTNKEETGWFLQTEKKWMFRYLKLSLLQFFLTVSAEPKCSLITILLILVPKITGWIYG